MKLTYDEISPITGNMCVLVEPDSTKNQNMRLCMESGYQTFDSWKEGSEIVDKFMSASPDLVRNTAMVDEEGNVWVKIIMMTPDVVLNPDIDDSLDSVWRVSSFKWLEEGESPKEGMISVKVGEKYKVLDEDTCSVFGEFEFEEATLEFYKRVNKTTEE